MPKQKAKKTQKKSRAKSAKAGKAKKSKASAPKLQEHLIQFYGEECTHCKELDPVIAKLEKQLCIKIAKKEVWHHGDNAQSMRQLDRGRCGGVPLLVNTKTDSIICGMADYKTIKAWATDKSKA